MHELGQPNQIRNSIVGSGLPAFLRRAHETEFAWQELLSHCQVAREELLEIPKLRLAMLAAHLGDWDSLPASVCPENVRADLARLHDEWKPTLRSRVEPTIDLRQWIKSLNGVRRAFASFNHRWEQHLFQVDLNRVNELREGYNEHYVFEKECACGSYFAASYQFQPLQVVTREVLLEHFPLLPTIPAE